MVRQAHHERSSSKLKPFALSMSKGTNAKDYKHAWTQTSSYITWKNPSYVFSVCYQHRNVSFVASNIKSCRHSAHRHHVYLGLCHLRYRFTCNFYVIFYIFRKMCSFGINSNWWTRLDDLIFFPHLFNYEPKINNKIGCGANPRI